MDVGRWVAIYRYQGLTEQRWVSDFLETGEREHHITHSTHSIGTGCSAVQTVHDPAKSRAQADISSDALTSRHSQNPRTQCPPPQEAFLGHPRPPVQERQVLTKCRPPVPSAVSSPSLPLPPLTPSYLPKVLRGRATPAQSNHIRAATPVHPLACSLQCPRPAGTLDVTSVALFPVGSCYRGPAVILQSPSTKSWSDDKPPRWSHP